VGIFWMRTLNNPPTATIPLPTLPNPNAYDTYVSAASLVTGAGNTNLQTAPLAQQIPVVQQNAAALQELRRGFSQPFLSPPRRSLRNPVDFPAQAGFRDLARLLSLEGKVYEGQGNRGAAAQSYLDCIRLGLDAPRGGVMISTLVGLACEAIGRRRLWELSERLDAPDARAAAKRLEQMAASRNPFAETMREEKWLTQAWLLEMMAQQNTFSIAGDILKMSNKTQPQTWKASFILLTRGKKRIFNDYSTYADALIAETAKPYSPTPSTLSAPDDPINQLTVLGADTARGAQMKDWDARMQTSLLTGVLALRAYKLEKGDYPTSLDALVSDGYLTKIPDDPFAGTGPLRYRRVSKDKYVLYSVGPDGKNDNGKSIVAKMGNGTPKRWAEPGMTGDFVARTNTY
jgi:hypothetical protein